MNYLDKVNDFGLGFICPRCGEEGWCKTSSGHRAEYLHAARTDPFWQVFKWGIQRGRELVGDELRQWMNQHLPEEEE